MGDLAPAPSSVSSPNMVFLFLSFRFLMMWRAVSTESERNAFILSLLVEQDCQYHLSWGLVPPLWAVLLTLAPAGVGFSFSDNKNDYNTGDDKTCRGSLWGVSFSCLALDNYHALLAFFDKFPQFSSNDFYVTGESYGFASLDFETLLLMYVGVTMCQNSLIAF